jgi:hypothetical protein
MKPTRATNEVASLAFDPAHVLNDLSAHRVRRNQRLQFHESGPMRKIQPTHCAPTLSDCAIEEALVAKIGCLRSSRCLPARSRTRPYKVDHPARALAAPFRARIPPMRKYCSRLCRQLQTELLQRALARTRW